MHRRVYLVISIILASACGGGNAANPDGGGLTGDAAATPDAAPISCPTATGHYCGGNGVGGDPNVLYECRDMVLHEVERCEFGACSWQPAGIPDRCPGAPVGDVPGSLVDALDAVPYVEGSCTDTSFPGWPYEAKRCTYTSGGVPGDVITATPSPERVGRWIMDSADEIPALAELRTTDPGAYEQGLAIIATAVMIQSGRIYPLQGDVIENLGDGYIPYNFSAGVTTTCGAGCYCRINSLHRTEWCAWQDHRGAQSYDACMGAVGDRGFTDAWAAQCLGNHAASWTADRNEHFRARAYRYQQAMIGRCSGAGVCTPGEVLDALRAAAE